VRVVYASEGRGDGVGVGSCDLGVRGLCLCVMVESVFGGGVGE
jgi:hypothetical protein